MATSRIHGRPRGNQGQILNRLVCPVLGCGTSAITNNWLFELGLTMADQTKLEVALVSTETKVVGIVCEQLQVTEGDVNRTSSFVDDLKADSLDVVELVMEFEDEFGITIPDDDYEKIRTVGDAVDYIEEKN